MIPRLGCAVLSNAISEMTHCFATQLCAVTLAMVLSTCAGAAPQSWSNGWSGFIEEQIVATSAAFYECTPVRLNYARKSLI